MASNKIIAILGGDTRQLSLAAFFAERGFTVRVFGLPCKEEGGLLCAKDWKSAVCGAVAVVLPLPACADGRRVHMPLAPETEAPLLTDVFETVKGDIPLFGGKFSPAVKSKAQAYGVRLVDYFENEELQQKNALPTAEGAVSVLMRETPRTVSGLPVAVTGYGRVAKALIRLLLAMGAQVTVLARKKEDILSAKALGCRTVHLTGSDALTAFAKEQTVIFNTVPHWLFSDTVLAEMSKESLIIDLASAPGGVDANAAAARGIRVIWALSLPGKYAPVTAGEIIAETVLAHLQQEGLV